MSMELFVVLALSKAPNQNEWQEAISNEGIPVEITEAVNISEHSGFLPMSIEGHDTGLYFGLDDFSDISSHFDSLANIDLENPVVYSLGYGGHFYECAVVFYSAAALVNSFDGVAFEPQGGTILNYDQLIEAGKQCHELATNE